MGARFSRGTLQDMEKNLRGLSVHAIPQVEEMMTEIAVEGKNDMQDRITTAYTHTGQDRVDSGRGEHAGRRVTDVMYDAVEYRVTKPVPAVVNAEVGWLDVFLKYFGYQEKGTEYIPAMNALRDSGAQMRDQVQIQGRALIRSFAKQIGK